MPNLFIQMKSKPKISVLMSVYNGEKFISESINSILNQTYKNFEFLIVNDGSTDNSEKIIKSFSDSRIKYFLKPNTGLTKSLNFGLKKSKGKFIARIDCDDISSPHRLEYQIKKIEKNKDLGLVASRALIIQNKNKTHTPFYSDRKIKEIIKIKNPFVHSSVLISKDLFQKINFYNETFSVTQDYDAWMRLSKISKLTMIDDVLVERHVLENSISKKKFIIQAINSFRVRKNEINIFKNFRLFLYQILTNLIPQNILNFIKKLI